MEWLSSASGSAGNILPAIAFSEILISFHMNAYTKETRT